VTIVVLAAMSGLGAGRAHPAAAAASIAATVVFSALATCRFYPV
jgi:hypothetical protein